MPDVVRTSRTLPWREVAKESDALRPMLLDQLRHEDFRGKHVLDIGTGEGRLAFAVARLGARVVGVDLSQNRLAHAHAYAGVMDIRNVEFVHGDVDKTPYHEFSTEPIEVVVSNLCMSAEIVWHASRALRPGGQFIFCCHHGDHWRETRRGSRWAYYEDTMSQLLNENRFEVDFMGVDTTVALFDDLREVRLFLRDATVHKWVEDGRWEELVDSFGRGEKHLTFSYLVAKARRIPGEYRAE